MKHPSHLCGARVAAQQPKKVPRIGLLSIGANPQNPVRWLPFLNEMKELGYVDGQNIIIERRFAAGKSERLPELVADLVRLKVDLVVATGPLENLAAKKETPTTAIVMMLVPDPTAAGLIASLAHPGGNVTGLSSVNVELSGKRVELLKEAVPNLTRLAILTHPAFSTGVYELMLRETETSARSLGLQRRAVEVRDRSELLKVFLDLGRRGLVGFVVYGNPVFYSLGSRSWNLRQRGDCQPSTISQILWSPEDSCPMERATMTYPVARPSMWTKSSKAPSPPISQWSNRRSSSSSSI
jgi:putative ABC transport system substrate-binding protein